jgi:hypothetical protein
MFLRIEPTLAALPAHLHPGTVSLTVFSPAIAGWHAITEKIRIKATDRNLLVFIMSSFLLLNQ